MAGPGVADMSKNPLQNETRSLTQRKNDGGGIGSKAVDSLISKLIHQLHDADPTVRRNAVGALRLHGRRASCAAEEVAILVNDEDARVRMEARRALSCLRDSAA